MGDYRLSVEALDDGTKVLAVAGSLDMAAAPAFRERLEQEVDGSAPVVLDLSDVSFMDSTAIGALIAARSAADMSRGRFAVVCGPGDTRRMIEYTGLTQAFDVVDTRDAAAAALA